MMTATNDAFISYRRDLGFAWAKLVWDDLRDHGIDVFLDLENVRDAGSFDAKILRQIEGRPYFIVVLAHESLDRCCNEGDWLRLELEHAVSTGRMIVPLVIAPFDFAEADATLDREIAHALRSANGVTVIADYFDAAMERLRSDRLEPIELSVRALDSRDEEFAEEARRRASDLPPPTPPFGPPPVPPAAEVSEEAAVEESGDVPVVPPVPPAAEVSEEAAVEESGDVPPVSPVSPAAEGSEEAAVEESGDVPPVSPVSPVAEEAAVEESGDVPPVSPAAEESGEAADAEADDVPPSAGRRDPVVPVEAPISETVVDERPTAGSEPRPVDREPDAPGPSGRRNGLVAAAVFAVLVAVVAAVAFGFGLFGGGDPSTQLRPDEVLRSGDRRVSSDGGTVLRMESDGRLVASTDGQIWFDEPARPSDGSYAEMQADDGNFVVYRTEDDPAWSTETWGHEGAYLEVNDGFFVILAADGDEIERWSR